ncbi:hypothetical protein [Pseudomonas amygdali]|uniref:hypothetical protein n=1 Tax=Pseudomonas amygdali TaxID=47877 RepID=UPI000709771E|nr:hypothetical protein [Pseudomonas amygdali]KWS79724.1 hypothetical protein AL052_25425 [Pseudomonas amygdali pv. eriobotryae]
MSFYHNVRIINDEQEEILDKIEYMVYTSINLNPIINFQKVLFGPHDFEIYTSAITDSHSFLDDYATRGYVDDEIYCMLKTSKYACLPTEHKLIVNHEYFKNNIADFVYLHKINEDCRTPFFKNLRDSLADRIHMNNILELYYPLYLNQQKIPDHDLKFFYNLQFNRRSEIFDKAVYLAKHYYDISNDTFDTLVNNDLDTCILIDENKGDLIYEKFNKKHIQKIALDIVQKAQDHYEDDLFRVFPKDLSIQIHNHKK